MLRVALPRLAHNKAHTHTNRHSGLLTGFDLSMVILNQCENLHRILSEKKVMVKQVVNVGYRRVRGILILSNLYVLMDGIMRIENLTILTKIFFPGQIPAETQSVSLTELVRVFSKPIRTITTNKFWSRPSGLHPQIRVQSTIYISCHN